MEILGLAFLIAYVVPLGLIVVEYRERQASDRWQKVGVVIVRDSALERREQAIGRYMDADIFEHVVFRGQAYSFSRVAAPPYKERLGRGELYLAPGLVYRAARRD